MVKAKLCLLGILHVHLVEWLCCRVQAAASSAECNVPGGLRLRGPLAEPALAGALARVLQRHDALRTHIVAPPGGGAPVQVVAPAAEAAAGAVLRAVDVAALPAGPPVDTSGLCAPVVPVVGLGEFPFYLASHRPWFWGACGRTLNCEPCDAYQQA